MIQGSRDYFKARPEKRRENVAKLQIAKEKWQREHPEEVQQQIKNFIKAGSEANSQKVRCINTGEIFPSISEAARHYNTHQTNISKVLKGERKAAGKTSNNRRKTLLGEVLVKNNIIHRIFLCNVREFNNSPLSKMNVHSILHHLYLTFYPVYDILISSKEGKPYKPERTTL